MKKQFIIDGLSLIAIAIVAIGAMIIFIKAATGQTLYTTATVPATYACETIKFDLVCQTNAQRILINGEEYKHYGN